MFRRPLALGALLVGVSGLSALTLGACESKHCTLVDCGDGANIVAHVETTQSALLQATTTVCFNERCSTVTPRSLDASVPTGKDDGSFYLGSPVQGSGSVRDEGGGWARLELSMFQLGQTQVADGDRYRVTIVGADGRSLLDVERFVTYSTFEPNGHECGPTCKVASISLYPDSQSGLTCTGKSCRFQPIVSFHKVIAVGKVSPYKANVFACINEKCSSPAPFTKLGGDAPRAELEGDVSGMAWFKYDIEKGTMDFELSLAAPSAILADGDRYRVNVSDPKTGETFLAFDDAVTYETEFPNGPACDRHPCRRLRIEAP